jgi:hypothetical protein
MCWRGASSRILVFISYVFQLFVPLLKAQLLPKLLGSFDGDYEDFCLLGCDSWYMFIDGSKQVTASIILRSSPKF